MAEVTFQTSLQRLGDQKYYRIEANGKTYPFFNWFFNLNDTYISRLEAETLRPLDLQIEIREGGYRVSSGYRYDWEQGKVSTFFFNHKRADSSHHVMTLQEGSFDALALFFNLRCENIDSFTQGEKRTLHMVLEDTIRTIQYRFVGREKKNIKDLGKFNTLKFVCQLATSSGESFKDGSEFTLWISDDRNKIPLYIESPIRVGSIRGRLLHAEKLKYPPRQHDPVTPLKRRTTPCPKPGISPSISVRKRFPYKTEDVPSANNRKRSSHAIGNTPFRPTNQPGLDQPPTNPRQLPTTLNNFRPPSTNRPDLEK